MKENGTITEHEEATLADAMAIMSRWLDAHKDEAAYNPGYWGIEEARHQLERNLGYMRGE